MTDGPALDRARIIEVLDRHSVEYLVVGGIGAQLHGATRATADFDSLPSTTGENLGRLAAALRELNAFLRVGGLSDAEARALPTRLDAVSLSRLEISTWRTDAGDLDVLTAIRRRDGQPASYDDLASRSALVHIDGIVVHVAALQDISPPRSSPTVRRTERPSTSYAAWPQSKTRTIDPPGLPWLGRSLTPHRTQASAVVAWR